MLRITLKNKHTGPTIYLEGQLVGPWVEEFQKFWESARAVNKIEQPQVDLNAVTSIDESGKALLRLIHQQGGGLLASGCLTKAIVEEVMINK